MFLVIFRASLHFHGCLPSFFLLPWCLFYLNVTFTFTFLSSICALNAKSKKWSSPTPTCDIVTYRAGAFAQLITPLHLSILLTYYITTFQPIKCVSLTEDDGMLACWYSVKICFNAMEKLTKLIQVDMNTLEKICRHIFKTGSNMLT